MNTIDKIRAEIKKLQDIFVETAQGMETEDEATVYSMCAVEFRDELLAFLDTLEEPVSDCHDLEEAAETKYPTRWKKYPNDGIVRSEEYFDLNAEKRDAFKAGAGWQYQKDRGEFAKIKAKTWCEGFDACKAKMMEGAVEGVVNHGTAVSYVISDEDQLDERLKQFQNDAEVRIIILQKEDGE